MWATPCFCGVVFKIREFFVYNTGSRTQHESIRFSYDEYKPEFQIIQSIWFQAGNMSYCPYRNREQIGHVVANNRKFRTTVYYHNGFLAVLIAWLACNKAIVTFKFGWMKLILFLFRNLKNKFHINLSVLFVNRH